ncbi:MAG: hypothetical protein WBM68_06525, partial [Woeseia sp.]
CVYRNGAGPYQLIASGNGTGGAFTLTDGVATVPYSVRYTDGTGTQDALSNVALTGLTGADGLSSICANTGNNATIEVTVAAADAASVPAATYIGTLTLLVSPQ